MLGLSPPKTDHNGRRKPHFDSTGIIGLIGCHKLDVFRVAHYTPQIARLAFSARQGVFCAAQ